jgi:hypothetical protein
MALKKFEEYAYELSNTDNRVSEVKPFSDLKNIQINKPVISKKINENSFLVGSDYKVKIVIDIPQSLVKEYIEKVKNETDKDPLDNFSEAEIAEQIVAFTIKQNLFIDNLTPDFTVGSENTQTTKEEISNDAEQLSDDLGVEDETTDDDISDEETSDGDIDFKEYNGKNTDIDTTDTLSDDETSDNDGEIEFNDETEEKDLGEERETDDSDPDSDFDEIEFDDNKSNKPKTIGDLKKTIDNKINTKHEQEETSNTSEEEEEIDDIYKKIGYKVGYHEKMNQNLNYRKYNS